METAQKPDRNLGGWCCRHHWDRLGSARVIGVADKAISLMSRWQIFPLLGGGSVGLIFVIFFTWYATLTAPMNPVLVGAPAVWRGAEGTVYIKINYVSQATPHCLRFVQYNLVRDFPDRRAYVSLGTALTGKTLRGSVYDFDVLRWVPADFPPGQWYMLARLHHECEPAGLVTWDFTMEPVLIDIPER